MFFSNVITIGIRYGGAERICTSISRIFMPWRSDIELPPHVLTSVDKFLRFGCKPICIQQWWEGLELNQGPQGFPFGLLALFR